jgi:hypothetical protein
MSRIEESKIVEEEESESRTMEKLDDIILDMYGNINNALTNNLIN